MNHNNGKAWLYLLPALLFLAVFMVYPLIDVFVYSAEEGYNFASQTYFGLGFYNYSYVLHDPYFLQALKNTFILVIITVPVSTGLALLISVGLNSIRTLRELFQTIYFLPYVTNTLAVGLVFMILFQKTEYTDGLVNLMIHWFGGESVDFIDGPYWAKMFVLCFYTVWVVLPFKILILTSALASVNPDYYKAARVDGTSRARTFFKITLPMLTPMIFFSVIMVTIGILQIFDFIYLMVDRQTLSYTYSMSLVTYFYECAFNKSSMRGYGAAISVVLAAIIMVITMIQMVGKKYWVRSGE